MPIQLDREQVAALLPKRVPSAHKGQFGTLALLCGSVRYRGAALLAADAALRVGTGIVQVSSIEPVCAAAATRLPCCTLLPLAATPEGGIQRGGVQAVLASGPSAVLAGCGLGNTRETAKMVWALLKKTTCPLVLDADALNVMAGHLDTGHSNRWASRFDKKKWDTARPLILTPHIGEMARLMGLSAKMVEENADKLAAQYAAAHQCVVVLKSYKTVVASPDGQVYLHDTGGNSGLAKGGSGDVLAGIIAGLAAQGITAERAAAIGVWLHGEAAALAAQAVGCAALSPAELPYYLGYVLKGLEEEEQQKALREQATREAALQEPLQKAEEPQEETMEEDPLQEDAAKA